MKSRVPFILSFMLVVAAFSFKASAQTISDKQIKTSTAPITNSLNYIAQLKPISYSYDQQQYKQLHLPGGTQYGFIAADVKQVLPSVVDAKNNWYPAGKGNQRAITTPEVDLQKLVPLLVSAIQEQQAQIEQLKLEVQQLKASK
ncbi:tail fiber domain-containing protein [Mucilaginibacter conchicola]|uniref:Tail fiber domain-containing protein n=1 Tax=Mucilaginibacter conchicola TaxID=2303333 RepID=A0A372NYV4_9SPHI|nr:tail fiber domain-containing protein [Mucilaginibacter conchicola]RFZ95296.1 tail fiber domain-containing protein [Mucilaginibacter conchicola]